MIDVNSFLLTYLLLFIVVQTLDHFRSGRIRVLVATDVAARGLDIKDIEVVINYEFPEKGVEDYVHRIGRTARGSNNGLAYSLFTTADAPHAKELVDILKRCEQVRSLVMLL